MLYIVGGEQCLYFNDYFNIKSLFIVLFRLKKEGLKQFVDAFYFYFAQARKILGRNPSSAITAQEWW